MTVFFYQASDKTQVKTSLDVDIGKDRAMLLYHPACDRNYTSSWQLLLDKYGNYASVPPYGKLSALNLDNGKLVKNDV